MRSRSCDTPGTYLIAVVTLAETLYLSVEQLLGWSECLSALSPASFDLAGSPEVLHDAQPSGST